MPQRHREEAVSDSYFQKLRSEYLYLAHKYSLSPIAYTNWRFLRLRPQNFPYIRIAQLASLCFNRKTSLAALTDCTTLKEVKELYSASVSPYWETHYTFDPKADGAARSSEACSTSWSSTPPCPCFRLRTPPQ